MKNNKKEWAEVTLEAARFVGEGNADIGIFFCWTGTGASIAANKVEGIRAALCSDSKTTKCARKWNHANVLVLSLRLTTEDLAKEILDSWFLEPYGKEEFDVRNVEKLSEMNGAFVYR